MQDFTIERVGQPNLDFTGEMIGQSSGVNPKIKIYRTKAGHYVGEIAKDSKRSDANCFDKPDLVVNWFRTLVGGISVDVQAAIEAATTKDEGFKKLWNQHVD